MYSSGFGATGASTSSPFSRPATTGFSPPVFGQTQATNTMFGSTTNQPTSLFGASTTTPAFGQTQTTQPAFGAFTAASSNTSSIFGTQQNATTSGGLFGSNTTQAFGQPKTSFGGFGTTQPSSGLFGQPQQQTSLFGQPAAQSASGLFGASPAFGATATAAGGTTFKFTPVTGTDTMVKNGASTSVSTRHHCITCMKEYENKSLEELRMEDYVAGRKGQQQGAQPAGLFGSTTQPTLFGTGASSTSTGMFGTENKSLFGTTNQGFGTTTATNMFGQTNQANSLFGKPAGTATPFGAPATTSTSNFGFNNTSSNLFGANTNQAKPFGTTAPQTGVLFGATSQPATGFGTQQTAFGTTSFGAQPAQNGGIFGQKQAFSLGGPSTGFAFNQPATTASTSLFGAKPATTGFGTGFGTNTSTSTGFGSTPFGQQNQNASPFGASNFNKPTGFPFGQTQPNTSLGMSLGGGTSLFNNTASKPGGLFGQTSTGSSLFSGGFGTTSTFNTGSSSLGLGTQPSLGLGTGLGTGLGSLGGLNTQNPISQHLNAYSAIPFGVCSLFKNLLAPTGKADELIKPTSPAAQKALISGQNYKISPKSTSKIKIRPVESNNENKKSLFDGLDEEDALNPVSRPNLKRLVVQPRLFNEVPSCNPINELSPVVKTSPRILLTPKTSLQRDNTSNNPVENARTLPNRRLHEWKPSISGISEQTSEVTQNLSSTCVNDEGKDVSAAISSSSDSDHEETPPPDLEGTLTEHPARITLRRAGYYTIPSLDELAQLVAPDGSCIIDSFTVGRLNYGNVYFPDSFDVAGLNLDDIVHFRHKEVVVYPDDDQKPPVGSGLNRRAQVTLDRVWPVDKSTRAPITDVKRLADLDYESKLMKACGKHHSTFIEYRPQTGSWVFKVEHFSKYGLSDSDEEDEEIKKIKIGPQDPKLVISKAMPSTPLNAVKDVRNTLPSRAVLMGEDDEEMDDGITTPFALDEMERRHLSPTSKLATATGTSSHKLQLMKASFFDRDFNIDGEYLGLEDLEQPPIFQINGYGVDSKKLAQAYNWYKKSEFADNYSDVDQDYPPSQEAEVEQQIPPRPASVEPEVVQQYIASAKIHPKAYVLRHKGFVPYSEVLEKAVESGALTDLCLTYGRASRIGWGPRSRLVVHNTVSSATEEPAPSLFSTIQGRNKNDMSPSLIQCHKLYLDDESQVPFLDTVAQHLQIIFKQSHFNREDSECPYVTPKLSVTGLHRHNSVATNLAKGLNDPYLKNAATIWSLCTALWGNVGDWSPESHSLVMERKAAVSDWLEIVLSEEVNQEASQTTGTASVYSLLSGHKIQEACDKAHELGDYQLSLVFNQCGSGAGAQSMMRAQLNQWRDTAADTRIDHGRLKCIMLAAGLKVHAMSNGVLNSCNDLTWLRAFALHLWYFTSVSASVTDALVEYEKSFTGPVEENYASSPVPLYSNQYTIESSSKTPIYDIRYHLLKLFSTKSYKMEPILDPATFTADSLDYRLSWFLLRVLSELGYSHVGSYSACLVHTSFASQLEAHGLWYWAVFVVQHHPEHKVREKLVKDLLERHVSLDATNEDEEFVQSILGIPVRWVYEAKAIKARIHKRYKDAANFLLKAGNWDESHNLIMNHIYSAAIVYEEYDYLEGLLKELSIEDRCREVNGWSVGGEVVLQYLDVVKQVNDIVAARDPSVGFLLERLQDQLKDLCLKIQLMKVNTPLDRLSQAEMSKRTANLVQNLAIHCNDDNPQGLRVLAHLIDELPLTSDLAHSQWQEVLAWWSRSCVMEVPSE